MSKHIGSLMYALTVTVAKVQWAAQRAVDARLGASCRHCGCRTHRMAFHLNVEHTPEELKEYTR